MAFWATGSLLLAVTAWMSASTPVLAVCRPEYRKRPTHTACQSPASWCKVTVSGVDAAERARILKMHNDYRSQVAKGRLPGFPAAADMQELLWDDEMADVAQAHASLCVPPGGRLDHDKHEDRFTTRFDITGQNLGLQFSSHPPAGPDWKPVIDGWFNEYADYPPDLVSGFPRQQTRKATGHFTQVVWAKSRYVGCGYAYYIATGTRLPHMRKYTCNYYEGGNVVTRPVYLSGTTCSACPPPTRCKLSTGLCGDQSSGQQVPRRPIPQTPVPQGPVPQAPVPQAPVPQAPVPQAPVPQAPVPQAQCTPELRRKRPTHTLCKPPNRACNIRNQGVSKADRSLILKLHNSYRSQVAQGRLPGFPTATDMFRMRWDDEMADVAQAHSNQCTEPGYAVDHDDQLDRSTSRFDLTGQNLAWAGRHWSPPTPNWTFIIDSWFNEYQYYSPQDVREFNPYTARQTKHFTQIIWAKSRYVGCGYVNYSFTDPSATPPYMEMYACNYAPTGNVVNVRAKLPIYDEGPTCSACPDNARCDQTTGLCGGKGRRPQSPLPPPPAGKVPDPQPSPNPVTAQPGSGGGGSVGQSGKSPGTDTSSGSPAEEDEPPSWLPFIAGLVAVTVALTCCLYFAFARRTKDQPQEQQAAPAGMGSQYSTASTTAL